MGRCGDSSGMVLILLQAFIDVLDVLWRPAAEANRLYGVVFTSLGRHGRQSQRGAKVHTMDGDLIDAAVHRVKACLGSFPLGIHLVGDLVHRRLQTIILCRQGYMKN